MYIQISFLDKSNGITIKYFKFKPNILLNHDLLNPTNPIKLTKNIVKKHKIGAVSNNDK